MKNDDIFKSGTKVQVVLYTGTDPDEAERMLESYKHLLKTSSIMVGEPGIKFDVKLEEIIFDKGVYPDKLKPYVYTILGKGVVI